MEITPKLRFKHIKRIYRLLVILAKYGLADDLVSFGLGRQVKIFQKLFPGKVRAEIKMYTRWERMRFAIEEMGTTAIKFAQILSTRPDIVPVELIYEFEKLQNNVPPFEVDKAKEILFKEWGGPLENFLDNFVDKPLAAASIAQVHTAKLKNGTDVVIKIQRPEISDYIHLDIEILRYGASLYMKRYGEVSSVDVSEVVQNFEVGFLRELSFLNEAANQSRFAATVADDENILVPGLYRHLCTEKVLVMDLIKGIKVTDVDAYSSVNSDPQLVAKIGMASIFRQIFEFGYFHGDPHPGNIFVLPGNKICFIDFGMMGSVLRSDLYAFADVLLGIRYANPQKVVNGIKNLMVGKRIPNERKLLIEIDDLIFSFNREKPEEINLEFYFSRIRDILKEQKIQMPADFFGLTRAMVTIEGVGRKIYPEMNILEELEPHLKGVFRDRYSPGNVWERVVMNAGDILSILETLPSDTRDIVQNIKEITGKYEGVERELMRFSKEIKKTSAKIELAIVLGIWLICSTILIAAKFPPMIGEVSSLGILGYFISAVVGYRLLRK